MRGCAKANGPGTESIPGPSLMPYRSWLTSRIARSALRIPQFAAAVSTAACVVDVPDVTVTAAGLAGLVVKVETPAGATKLTV